MGDMSIPQGDEHILSFWPDGKVLQSFYNDWKRNVVIIGPLGSGKTICAINKVFDAICEQPPDLTGVRRSKWCVIRNTDSDLRGTTIPDWLSVVPAEAGRFFWSQGNLRHELDFDGPDGIPVKCTVHFLPLDRPDSAKKLRGYQLTGVWLNETKELDQNVVTMASGRVGRYPRHNDMPIPDGCNEEDNRYWRGMIGDTNSPDDTHWLYQIAEHPTQEDLEYWSIHRQPGGVIYDAVHGKYVTNPRAENLSNLSGDYYREQIAGAPTDWIKVNLCNLWGFTVRGAAVVPEYSDSVHSPENYEIQYIQGLQVYAGIDYGRTPAAALFQEINGSWQVFDEFPTKDMSAPLFADHLKRYLATVWGIQADQVIGFADPAGGGDKNNRRGKTETSEDSATQIMRMAGFKVRPSPIDNRNLYRRRKSLVDPLMSLSVSGRPRLLIARRCKTLRAGLSGKWYFREIATGGEERYTEVPEKNHYSHVCEALEYGMIGVGEGKIHHTLKSGNDISTSASYRPRPSRH